MSINKITDADASVGGLWIDGTELTATATELNVLDLSANLARSYVKVISITAPASTAEQDTDYDLPALGMVTDVAVLVTAAASAGSVVDVGLLSTSSGGDADGFLDGVSSTGTGTRVGGVTVGSSGYLVSSTVGTFLQQFNVTTSSGGPGTAIYRQYPNDSVTAKSVSWTINSTGTAFAGKIYLNIVEFA